MSSLIELVAFEKSYGVKRVHDGIDLSVFKGECLGLIGGSGSGKSVLLRSLIGLERPDGGQILFDGIDITKLSEKEMIPVRKRIAYAFQDGALFDSMSVFENLAYPLRAHTNLTPSQISMMILKLLADFGLAGNEKLLPASLSGGMQKRVGLARAMILNPDVILYDEPTAGLDPYNTQKIQDLILRLKQLGKTGILVTHDMPVAFKVCDRIAMLENGKIGTVDAVASILKNPNHPIMHFAQGEVA
ncbi:MAG: ABC transporter ATP-binding protein [Bdellovibrio sp.]|jgi:phospholipid/cholesterol/gamma-HCH transport system ATP-binding protein